MIDCDLFRSDLDAYRDDMLDEVRKEQMAMHLQHCRTCSDEIRRLDSIEAEIRVNAEQWLAPAGLWERVQSSAKSLETPTTSLHPPNRKPVAWTAVAAFMVTVVIIGFNFTRWNVPSPSKTVAAVLVNEFHTFVVSQRQLDYTDTQPLAIRQWFGDKVDFRAPVPIETMGLQLSGGRLCNMLDQRVASYMYQSNGAWVSLYIMKSKSELGKGMSDEVMLRGYGFMEWENDGLHYSLVGDIAIGRLRQIAKVIYSRQLSSQPLQSNLLYRTFLTHVNQRSNRRVVKSGQPKKNIERINL